MADKKGKQESMGPTPSYSWLMFKLKHYLFNSTTRCFTSKVLKTLPWDNTIQWLREKKVTPALHY
jgi:hypothetical protein